MLEAPDRRRFLKLGFFAGMGALTYTFLIERYLFQVNTYSLPLPALPGEFNGYTIVQLTDLHFGFLMPLAVIKNLIHKANSLEKDIIVCTGDYIHQKDSSEQIDRVWPELCRLEAKDGVYSVLGNHDHWGDFSRSLYWLGKSGQNLRHKAISIQRGSKRVWLGGCGDYWEDEIGIGKAFQNVPERDFKILLAHNPDTADTRFSTKIDLMISGHTHGGQVSIPFLGPPVLPVRNKKYSSGFIKAKTTNIFISKGLGWAILPVRFNCLPEISVLKLFAA